MNSRVKRWLKKHTLPELLSDLVIDTATSSCSEFYIRLDSVPNKNFVERKDETDLVEWLRLTHKLFLS